MAVTRSPKYPQFNLREAIEKTRKVYDREKWHPADEEVIAQNLGYKGINGASLGTIATLKRYGLLVPADNGKFRVSDIAITLIEAPQDNPEWIQAITEAAFRPALFDELRETFGDNLPSDANLRHFLIKKRFNPKAAEEVIRVYRETIESIKHYQFQVRSNSVEEKPSDSEAAEISLNKVTPLASSEHGMQMQNGSIVAGTNSGSGGISEVFNVRLSADCKAYVQYEGTVTQEAIQKFIKYLELSMDDFPTQLSLYPD